MLLRSAWHCTDTPIRQRMALRKHAPLAARREARTRSAAQAAHGTARMRSAPEAAQGTHCTDRPLMKRSALH